MLMVENLKVIYVTPEITPFAKSGELADVAASLPKYLSSLPVEVSVFVPKYRKPEIESLPMESVNSEVIVPLGGKKVKAQIFRSNLGRYDIYFVDNPAYFWREGIYGTGKGEYLDNDERFIFFNRAILEFLVKSRMEVDIIHCNNWPSAFIPAFLKTTYSPRKELSKLATVLTLHNIAYQGEFPPETLALTGLNWDYLNSYKSSFNGKFNFLKSGIIHADVLNTVSLTYKREILQGKHGNDMRKELEKRKDVFFSIRNGVDYETWDPKNDPYLSVNYSPSKIHRKKECKLDLIHHLGLSLSLEQPLVGVASFITPKKGIDILVEAVEGIMALGAGLVVVGMGDETYEKRLLDLEKKYPKKMCVKLDPNPSLSHKLVAGADIFLIPSLFEPCGLNQLYSFRYGTVPVVRHTGGLAETVKPFDPRSLRGNGFVFREYSSRALLEALKKAFFYFAKPEVWKRIVVSGLKEDFSWEVSARKYLELYRKALKIKRGG